MRRDIRSFKWLPAAAFACAVVSLSLMAEAQIAGPCAETVATHCGDVTPGGGRIMKCLQDHRDEQSIACKDWLDDQNRSLKALHRTCAQEIGKLCSFAASDDVLYRCLEDNYVSLTSDCRGQLREIKDRLQ